MKSELSFNTLRLANVIRCEQVFHKLHDWSPTDWACAMAGECGEVCNEVKKLKRLEKADSKLKTPTSEIQLREKIALELADLIIYADLLAARLDINLEEAITYKFNLVSEIRNSYVKL